MSSTVRDRLASRLTNVRRALDEQDLPALVVTHLPNVCYLTGFAGSGGAAIVAREGVTLVTDSRYADTAAELVGSDDSPPDGRLAVVRSSYDAEIARLVQEGGYRRVGIEAAHLPVARWRWFERWFRAEGGNDATVLVPTERVVERGRAVKDDREIATLRRAGEMLSAVAREARAWLQPGVRERDVAARVESAIKMAGFERCAFETIVASGPNSARPHARAGDRRLRAGDLVVLDLGGVYDGYCVDLTRTVSLGPPAAEAVRVHAAVCEAQAAAIAAVRPGARGSEVDGAAREILARHGLDGAFGHSIGHGIGLEVHEDPRFAPPAAAREAVILTAGMAFTIEPGVYLPGWGGVRVEDDVLVTPDGHDLLTHVPRNL